MKKKQAKNWWKRLAKTALWLLASIVLLVFLLVVALQFPSTQNFITTRATNYIEGKTGTPFSINEVNVAFPKSIVLRGLYFESQSKDTLVQFDELNIDADLYALLDNHLSVNDITLTGLTARINRQENDSTFNFQYIIDAFADDEKKTDNTSAPWKFSINNINFNNADIRFDDYKNGTKANGKIGKLSIALKELNFKDQGYFADKITLTNSSLKLNQSKVWPSSEEDNSDTKLPDLELQLLNIKNVIFNYTYTPDQQEIKGRIGNFEIEPSTIDLASLTYDAERILLENSNISYVTRDKTESPKVTTQATIKAKPSILTIDVNNITLANNTIVYWNKSEPSTQGFNPNHLHLTQLSADIPSLTIEPKTYRTTINNLSFDEMGGIGLVEFKTRAHLGPHRARLDDLHIQTYESYFDGQAAIRFDTLATLGENLKQLFITSFKAESEISVNDLLYIQPKLVDSLDLPITRNDCFKLKTIINGKLNDLTIEQLAISDGKGNRIDTKGKLRKILTPELLNYDLNIKEIAGNKQSLLAWAPTLNESAHYLPSNFRLDGKIKGTIKQMDGTVNLRSSLGDIKATASFDQRVTGHEKYTVQADLKNINLKKILNDNSLNTTNLTVSANGTGLDPKTMKSHLDANINAFNYNGYDYSSIRLKANLNQQKLNASLTTKDDNLNIESIAELDLSEKSVGGFLEIAIDKLDLKAVNLSADPISLSGDIVCKTNSLNPSNMLATIQLKEAYTEVDGGRHKLSPAKLTTELRSDKTTINLKADALTAYFNSDFEVTEIGHVITDHFKPYFDLSDSTELVKDKHHFDFGITILKPELLEDVVIPGLDKIILKKLDGKFDGTTQHLQVNLDVPLITYDGITADSIQLALETDERRINYVAQFKSLKDNSYQIHRTEIAGWIKDNTIQNQLIVNDEYKNQKFNITTALSKIDSGFTFSIIPKDLLLSYREWTVKNTNEVFFNKSNIRITDLNLEHHDNALSIATSPSEKHPEAITANFENFHLLTLSNIIETKDTLVDGIIDGGITLFEPLKNFAFSSDLLIRNFSFKGDTLGDLSIKSKSSSADVYSLQLRATSEVNDIKATGKYWANRDSMALSTTINKLSLATIEAYTAGQLTEMKGKLSGKLALNGHVVEPLINGSLSFKDASFKVNYLNMKYTISQDQLTVQNTKFIFNKFDLRDARGNDAQLDGFISTKNFDIYDLHLDVNTNNFQLLNTSKQMNGLYYGDLFVASTINIRGNSDAPKVDANMKVLKGTNLTFVVPEDQVELDNYDQIVTFVDMDTITGKLSANEENIVPDTAYSDLKGITLNSSLEIDEDVIFKVIIDPRAGDYLEVAGKAALAFNIDPSGKLTLSGLYEVTDGAYEMTYYTFIKRRFEIMEGSSISWRGDPYRAKLDIRATHITKASALPLVNSADDAGDVFKQALPIEVKLLLTDELVSPDINFNLSLPNDQQNFQGGIVQSRLQEINQDEAELNKQVFSLLLFNRFMPANSFSGGGSSLGSTARNSVSQMVSDQLNALAGKHIKGISINVGVDSYEDYSTGSVQGKTELSLELSKELFNERLTVSVGSNVEVEGTNQDGNGGLAQDISLEYKLSENGQYRLRVQRKNQYEGVIDGNLTKTGVAFIFARDYNHFRELFKKKDKEKNKEESTDD